MFTLPGAPCQYTTQIHCSARIWPKWVRECCSKGGRGRTGLFARLVGDWLFCDKESGEDAVEATQIHRLAWLKFLQRLVRLDFEK